MERIRVIGADQGKRGALALCDVYRDRVDLIDYHMITSDHRGIDFHSILSWVDEIDKDLVDVVITESQFVPKGQGHSKEIFGNEGFINGMLFSIFRDKFATPVPSAKWVKAVAGGTRKIDRYSRVKSLKCYVNRDMSFNGLWDAILIAYYVGKVGFSREIMRG